MKPHACRFLTKNNLCSIYEARPVVCRKFPYTVLLSSGRLHAYYVDVPWSECQGYREKKHLKKQWLSPIVDELVKGTKEAFEAVDTGFFQITQIT